MRFLGYGLYLLTCHLNNVEQNKHGSCLHLNLKYYCISVITQLEFWHNSQSYFTPKDVISKVGIGVEVSQFHSNDCVHMPSVPPVTLSRWVVSEKAEKVRKGICATIMETWLK